MDPYNSADQVASQNAVRPPPVSAPNNPYAAPSAAVRDVADGGDLVLASRLGRLGAVLIDAALLFVPVIILLAITGGLEQGQQPSTVGLIIIGVWAIALAVVQVVLLYRNGQTVGKKVLGVRIVRPDGSRASFGRLLGLRYFVPGLIGAIPLVGAVFSLVDPLFIFADDRRTLHDKIADTIVVNA